MEKISFNRKGVTLVELLLVLGLLSIVIATAYSIFFTGNKSFEANKGIGFAQRDARFITDYIKNEIRTARGLYINDDDMEDIEEYYLLALNRNKKLYISHSKDGNKNKTIGSPVDSIEFILIRKDPDDPGSDIKTNVIGLVVNTEENGYRKQYKTDISFENGNVIVIPESTPEPISTIYYTKY